MRLERAHWPAFALGAMAAGLAALALVVPGRAGAEPPRAADLPAPQPFGINGGILFMGRADLPVGRHVRALAESGIDHVRAQATWARVQPQAPRGDGRPAFDWTYTDEIATALAGAGHRWYLLLAYSTAWGSTQPGNPFAPPRPKPFAAYAAAVARRYGRRGDFWAEHPELPYLPVTSYEVYNEPNLAAFWRGAPQPDRYADVYLATHEAVHRVDPWARVVVGGLADSTEGEYNAPGFLRAMAAARPGLAERIDALGVHVYADTPAQIVERVAVARSTLDAIGARDATVDLNETGWPTQGTLPLTTRPVSEDERRRRFAALIPALAATDCGIGTVLPFAWVTAEELPGAQFDWYGLADPRTAVLKPSGRALAEAISGVVASPPPSVQTCHRPDLGRLPERGPVASAFDVRATRRCAARRLVVGWSGTPTGEPFAHWAVRVGSRRVRTVADPDGAGPLVAPARVDARLGGRPTRVAVRAYDDLGRQGAAGVLRVPPCRRG